MIESSATYLMWLDVQAISTNAEKLASALRASTGLIVSAGSVYRGDGTHFLRLNFACPPAMLADGLNRLAKGIKLYGRA